MDAKTVKQIALYWLIGLLSVVAVTLLSSCVRPMVRTRMVLAPYRLIFVDSLESSTAQAITGCDSTGTPLVEVLRTELGSSGYDELLAHERKHVTQMALSGMSCHNYLRVYVSSESFRLVIESQAYCAGLKEKYGTNANLWPLDVPNVVRYLSSNYRLTMSQDSILHVVLRECKAIFLPP
jgi:hypothetical protein